MSEPSASGSGNRLLVMALLLVTSLALAAVLAWQAITTASRHRATAERALHDYADFAAFIIASRSYRLLGGEVVETFANWPSRPVPSVIACEGGATTFEQPPGRPLRSVGAELRGRDELLDTLRSAMALLAEAGWRFRFIALPATGADGVFIASYQVGGGWGLRGFTACLGGAKSAFRQVMIEERALPPALAGDTPPDSLLALRVGAGRDTALYLSGSAEGQYEGTARLGTEFGDMAVRVALRPGAAARLVIGGMPTSPTPLAVGLLALSTLLVISALVQMRREYELIATRSGFVSNVSHELRTPLSQILLFTELLKLGKLRSDAERERALDIVDQETRRLIRLVENVLQFSRAGQPRRRLDREVLPVDAVVRDTLEAFRPLAAARAVMLRSEIPAGLAVRGDRHALRQILLNLLDNAVKYGPGGQTVTVEARALNGRTLLAVEDQGPGIPRDDRERVWEGFHRLARETESAVAGSGIGLSVVRSLAGDMGGRTWNEDAPGGGARFVVELPAADEA